MKENMNTSNPSIKSGRDFDYSKSRSRTKLNTKQMALCGLMGGLCAVLMMFRFPLPFMPPFMDFDFTGMVEVIGGFAMGPVAAFAIIVIKLLLKVLTQGTTSMWTGELSNLILSCAFVLPAVMIYDRHKTRKMAIIGMIAGTILGTILAVLTNLYIIIPFYASFMGLTMDKIIAMCEAVNPFLNSKWRMAFLGIVPFNLIKFGVQSLLTFFVYKKLSRQIKHFIE